MCGYINYNKETLANQNIKMCIHEVLFISQYYQYTTI